MRKKPTGPIAFCLVVVPAEPQRESGLAEHELVPMGEGKITFIYSRSCTRYGTC